jgi:hypothetical protein
MLDLTQGIDHVLNRESTLLLRHNFDQIYNERDEMILRNGKIDFRKLRMIQRGGNIYNLLYSRLVRIIS